MSVGILSLVVHGVGVSALLQRLTDTRTAGDWYYLSLVDPLQPFAAPTFRWAPLAAWMWHSTIVPIGFAAFAALHVGALLLLRDWRAILLAAFPFWADTVSGNVVTFVLVAAWFALRGSRPAALIFVALFALMPRPLMVPVLLLLLWQSSLARWIFVAAAAIVVGHAAAVGQLGPWIERLATSGAAEIANAANIGPSALIGGWWIPIGLGLAVFLLSRKKIGLASLALSPYWIANYPLFALLDLDTGRANSRRPEIP